MSDEIWQQARTLLAEGVIADVTRVPDDCGIYRLVRIDFLYRLTYMVAGEEDFEGEPAGYTYAVADADGEPTGQMGGDPDLAKFSDDVRELAGAVASHAFRPYADNPDMCVAELPGSGDTCNRSREEHEK